MDRSDLKRKIAQYTVALGSVACAIGLIYIVPAFKQRGAFVLFLAAVAITTSFGGWKPGLLAIALTAVVAAYKILPPDENIFIQNRDDILRLGLFILVAVLIASLHTSKEKALVAQKRSEQRLALALDAAGMGAWEYNIRTEEFFWLPGLDRLFGRGPGEFPESFHDFLKNIHPEDQKSLSHAVLRPGEQGKNFEVENRIVLPNGQTRWIITRGRILYGSDAKAERMIAVVMDNTERKQREQLTGATQTGHEKA